MAFSPLTYVFSSRPVSFFLHSCGYDFDNDLSSQIALVCYGFEKPSDRIWMDKDWESL